MENKEKVRKPCPRPKKNKNPKTRKKKYQKIRTRLKPLESPACCCFLGQLVNALPVLVLQGGVATNITKAGPWATPGNRNPLRDGYCQHHWSNCSRKALLTFCFLCIPLPYWIKSCAILLPFFQLHPAAPMGRRPVLCGGLAALLLTFQTGFLGQPLGTEELPWCTLCKANVVHSCEMWCDVTWCDVMWRDVTWCDVMWRDANGMWCEVMRCDLTQCEVIWYDGVWRCYEVERFYLEIVSGFGLSAPGPAASIADCLRREHGDWQRQGLWTCGHASVHTLRMVLLCASGHFFGATLS